MSVFISYRRDGGQSVAKKIYDFLSNEYDVFLDTESLNSGYFDTAIISKIESCTDFIVIVTESTFNRCSEPNDWIFHEAQIALRENKIIIPVFIDIKSFPENVPESISEIRRFNGIFWSEKDDVASCDKIKSFLHSNRRYILNISRVDDAVCLSDDSKEEIKNLYKRFVKNGRLPVDIQIHLQDVKEIAELIVKKDVLEEHGAEFAYHLAEQSLLNLEKNKKESLEVAIEFMLQDEMLDSCSIRLRQEYISRYGLRNCYYVDENGIELWYWTPLLWINIIEEMLKELLYDRNYIYANSRADFTEIDCFVETRKGDIIWTFCSFIQYNPSDEAYSKFMEIIGMPGGKADYMDIPLTSLAYNVYPDFYYNIGLLKTNHNKQLFDSVNRYNGVFNLWYYNFGMH